MYRLHFKSGDYVDLQDFLLAAAPREQAAFVYFSIEDADAPTNFYVREVELLTEADFVAQDEDYLEISDETRQRMIITAHNGGLAVVEFHSHPFDLPAEFSYADYLGLGRTVPHILWRLKRRPYAAVVVGPKDFDGLVWFPTQQVRQLETIVDGDRAFAATGRSLERWLSTN